MTTSPTKKCATCSETKPVTEFHKRANRKSGVQSACKTCGVARVSKQAALYKERNRANFNPPAEQRCCDCERTLPASAFWMNLHRRSGLQAVCIECRPARQRKVDKATVRRYLKNRTEREASAPGVRPTEQELHDLALSYNFCCQLCGGPNADTWEHMTPLSRGGSAGIENLIPAHKGCNSAKGSMTMCEFVSHPSYRRIRQAADLTSANDFDTQ